MTTTVTYGVRVMDRPDGMLKPVHFPSMASMDQGTGEGMINRILQASGAGTRDLPRPIKFQFAATGGHDGARPIGRLDQVTFHEDGNVEGWGWLVDNDDAREAMLLIRTNTQPYNSVDLAETEVEIDFHWDDMDAPIDVMFTKWKISSTTGVADPAFANARMEITDELTASLSDPDEPFAWDLPTTHITWPGEEPVLQELAADGALKLPWDDFHIPESETPHKIVVDEDGRVYGHLALFSTCHEGYPDRCVLAPRGGTSAFNHPGPLTDKGQVGTGPIFFTGGHPNKPLGNRTAAEAYGGIENAWADVRATEGRHGIWVSGRVRPGLSADMVHAARCSHISGHWRTNGELAAIVSVNAPGFVPGKGFVATDAEGRLELVASFPGCTADEPVAEVAHWKTSQVLAMLSGLTNNPTWSTSTFTHLNDGALETGIIPQGAADEADVEDPEPVADGDYDAMAEALAMELELD